MKSIEDIKTELVLKMLQGPLDWRDIEKLPKNDELRTFICQFEPKYAYWYAFCVDEKPQIETKSTAYKDPRWAYAYTFYVDEKPSEEAKKAISKSPEHLCSYKKWEQEYNRKLEKEKKQDV